MSEQQFELLVESIRQAGEIRRRELQPGRVFEFSPLDVNAMRARLEQSKDESAHRLGARVATLQTWEQGPSDTHDTGN